MTQPFIFTDVLDAPNKDQLGPAATGGGVLQFTLGDPENFGIATLKGRVRTLRPVGRAFEVVLHLDDESKKNLGTQYDLKVSYMPGTRPWGRASLVSVSLHS